MLRTKLAVLAAIVLGAGAGYALVNRDEISDRLREVTLPCATRTSSASRPRRRTWIPS